MEGEDEEGVFIKSHGAVNDLNSLKITIVGDPAVGKTCLLITYTNNQFPSEYVPTVFENCPGKVIVNGKEHNLYLWDTAGQEGYERLRHLCYQRTHCFILCFSINDRTSLENIYSKWYPEVNRLCSSASILLIGTKSDLRQCIKNCITPEEGNTMRKRIGAIKYLECSALNKEGLSTIFMEAIRYTSNDKSRSCYSCMIL